MKSKDLNKKIIIGPSFPIGTANNTFELLFSSYALCKGWNIIPLVCDSIQQTECNVISGVWLKKSFKSHCKECNAHSQNVWNKLLQDFSFLSYFVESEDELFIRDQIIGKTDDDLLALTIDGISFGHYAFNIITNHHNTSRHQDVPGFSDLLSVHLSNLILLYKSYSRFIQFLPALVICNDVFMVCMP